MFAQPPAFGPSRKGTTPAGCETAQRSPRRSPAAAAAARLRVAVAARDALPVAAATIARDMRAQWRGGRRILVKASLSCLAARPRSAAAGSLVSRGEHVVVKLFPRCFVQKEHRGGRLQELQQAAVMTAVMTHE